MLTNFFDKINLFKILIIHFYIAKSEQRVTTGTIIIK